MQRTTSYKTVGLGLMTAIVFGMAACDSGDYSSKRSSDSTATVSAATTTSSDSSTGAAATKSPAATATTHKKRVRASITMPGDSNEKMVKDREGVYNFAQQMPEFPGGQNALAGYLNDHIDYNQQAIDNNTDGTMRITFVVDENGKVMRPRLLGNRKVGDGLDEETLKVFNNMPNWKPGKVNGKNVKTRVELPIVFQLEA
ncbi:MAG TPA: TonB family protein [Puia sp.]|jgi:TonB family protein|nr:TonB family protein [Puia sp.]